jgi:hypothetical protein
MDPEEEEIEDGKLTSRSKELSGRKEMWEKLKDLYDSVNKGFDDQRRRSNEIADNWDAYNSILSDNQYYSGNSQIFVPIVNDAVNARKTRFVNQLFPQNGRYVEVVTGEADPPTGITSLLEHYIRKTKLRTQVAAPLTVSGDCEGQYTIYTGWRTTERFTARREQRPVVVDGMEVDPDMPGGEPIDTMVEEKVKEGLPYVELIPDVDVLILPATSDSIEEALEAGGSVTIQRRWSKAAIRRMIKEGDVSKSAGEKLLEEMTAQNSQPNTRQNTKKDQAKAAGIKAGGKHVLGYETWTRLKVDGDLRLCVARFGGENQILGCKLCPYWSDLVPLISAPVEKVAGVFKGKPPVSNVLSLQIFANDTINEGADTSHFSAMPPILTDPLKNPRIETMIYGLGAVWSTSPNDTKILQFPELWRTSIERTAAIKEQIFQSLGVNPAMVPQGTGQKKRNQAEIATEQQVDILTTADAVTIQEEGIYSPLLLRWAWYDHQFRDEAITIKKFGEMGLRANMERIEPIQIGDRYDFRWYGVEAARNAARLQQQTAVVATMIKIPPQMYPDYEFDISPLMVSQVEDVFGPRLGPLIFKKKSMVTVDPETENQMLLNGFEVKVHFGDDDIAHIQAHMPYAQDHDPIIAQHAREHIQRHQKQMQAKADMQMKQAPGAPGGGGGQGPQAGAQPTGQVKNDQPPGAIHQDQMPAAGAVGMPRKM